MIKHVYIYIQYPTRHDVMSYMTFGSSLFITGMRPRLPLLHPPAPASWVHHRNVPSDKHTKNVGKHHFLAG